MSQTDYSQQGSARVGQKFALLKDEVLSYAAEVAIPVGRFVCLGSDLDQQVKLPGASTDVTALAAKRGVALHSHALESVRDGLDPQYPATHSVSVLAKGGVFVEVEEDVVASDAVYVRYAGKKQVQTITLSTDLITGNKVNGKVGGISIAEITYASSHAATWAAVAAAIEAANPKVLSAVAAGDVITVTTVQDEDDQDLADWVVTLGASQPTVTLAETVASVNTSKKGLFRNDADSSSAAALSGARWLKASELVDGKKLAVLELGVA